jgi:hypothetical protein
MRKAGLCAIACWGLWLTACGGAEIEASVTVDGVTVESDNITMPVGYAVAVEIISAGEDEASAMLSRDLAVVGVAPTGRQHEYVVYGVQGGQSVLDIHIDGPLEASIEVVVARSQ